MKILRAGLMVGASKAAIATQMPVVKARADRSPWLGAPILVTPKGQ